MKKLLVSDFMDTLMPASLNTINKIYGSKFYTREINRQQEIEGARHSINKLKDDLIPYLDEGNELVIVSSGYHDDPVMTANIFFKKIYNMLYKYPDQVKIYIQDPVTQDWFFQDKYKQEKDGVFLITDSYKYPVIKFKSQIYDLIDTSNRELYAIGDSNNDIDMLVRNITLGGTSTLINYELLTPVYYPVSLEDYSFTLKEYTPMHKLYCYAREKIHLEEMMKRKRYDVIYRQDFETKEKIINVIINEAKDYCGDSQEKIDELYHLSLIYSKLSEYYSWRHNHSDEATPDNFGFDIDHYNECIGKSLLVESSFPAFCKNILNKQSIR